MLRFPRRVGARFVALLRADWPGVRAGFAALLISSGGDLVTGLTLAFGETSGGFRRLIQIVFGLSIAFAASSFFLTFFQFGGGVTV